MTMMPPTMEPRMIHVLAENAELVVVSVVSEAAAPVSVAVTMTVGLFFLTVGVPEPVLAGGGVLTGALVVGLLAAVLELDVLLVVPLVAVSVGAVFVFGVVVAFEVSDVLEGFEVSAAFEVSEVGLAVPVSVFVAAPPVPVPVPVFAPPPPPPPIGRIPPPPCLLIFLTILSEPMWWCLRTTGSMCERPLTGVGPIERAAKRATRAKAALEYLTISAARRYLFSGSMREDDQRAMDEL
jgi:hypothetical protein